MSKCYIFAEGCSEKGCFSVCLDHAHEVTVPLKYRDFSEMKLLQKNRQTIAVLPTQFFNLYQVSLPKVTGKTARAAIPFALEEQLAQNIMAFHFAFDQTFYQDGRYLVVVCEKSYLTDFLAILRANAIQWDSLTIDWFALEEGEIAISEHSVCVKDAYFQGVIDEDLAALYWQKASLATETRICYRFLNTGQVLFERFTEKASSVSKKEETLLHGSASLKRDHAPTLEILTVTQESYEWIAHRLSQKKFINLGQGEFETATASIRIKRWSHVASVLGIAWLLMFIIHKTWEISYLNKQLAAVDIKIGKIYHVFFPQATQVISPKFRITQLLKANHNQEMNQYWHLLNALAKHWDMKEMELDQMRFQNQTLFITLITKDFQSLETLYNHLRREGIQVKQKQAAMSHQKVMGTVELH